jgi:PAS domain S-box-containing protein
VSLAETHGSEGTMSDLPPNRASDAQISDRSVDTARPAALHGAMSGDTIKVLLVEDNPGDVALLNVMLSEESGEQVSIETASRLSEAVERLDRGGIDVVLLDLTLPDARGVEAITGLKRYLERVPVIVQTGIEDEGLAVKAMQLGAQDYIVKDQTDGRLLGRSIRYAIERTRTTRELSDQRRRLDALLNNVPDRIYFKNREGAFIQVNPALARLYGFEDPAQVIGKADGDFFSEEHARQARADEDEVLRTGKPIIGKMEKETFPDGRTTWALTTKMPLRDGSGAIVGTFGVSRDITELKTAELALRSSEDRYERLLDSVSDYVYTVVYENDRPSSTEHGPGCLGVTGYSPDEFKSDPWLWHRIIFHEDRDAVVNGVKDAAKSGEAFEIEHRIVRKDGKVRWVRNKHVPRRDNAGRILSYDGLMSDITEKKRASDELRDAQAQLMQVEKLHSVGQLAAGVAHEVKNPLQVMLVGIQYLKDLPLAASEETRAVLADMNTAVRRANDVVQDLLDFSSPRELGMQPRPINPLIEQSLRFVRHDFTKAGIKIVTHLAANLPDAFVDPTKIEQVFINLFTNACHAMSKGGTLTVSSHEKTITATESPKHDRGDRSGIRFRSGERAIVIEIRDTGTGVPHDKLGQIFEPFYTTKSTGKGTGLGLSVTLKIIDLHGGKISIANHPDGGVTVTLTLKTAKPGDSGPKTQT